MLRWRPEEAGQLGGSGGDQVGEDSTSGQGVARQMVEGPALSTHFLRGQAWVEPHVFLRVSVLST